jgi:hypothetical protein
LISILTECYVGRGIFIFSVRNIKEVVFIYKYTIVVYNVISSLYIKPIFIEKLIVTLQQKQEGMCRQPIETISVANVILSLLDTQEKHHPPKKNTRKYNKQNTTPIKRKKINTKTRKIK